MTSYYPMLKFANLLAFFVCGPILILLPLPFTSRMVVNSLHNKASHLRLKRLLITIFGISIDRALLIFYNVLLYALLLCNSLKC